MTFEVRFSVSAEEDLARPTDFLLERATTREDLDLVQAAIDGILAAVLTQLAVTPYSFRKIGKSQTRRELIIPLGATGYVALYEIMGPASVLILALRHQREEDYQ